MNKKLLSLLLCSTLVLSLSACGGDSDPKPVEDGSAASSSQAPEEETPSVTIQADTVLLEQDGLVITAKELVEDRIWGPGVSLLVENNSQQNLTVTCSDLAVNNYMMTDLLFSADVAAGKKSNETLYLSEAGLEAAGIAAISDIDVSFHVYDEGYSTVLDSELICLPTSLSGTVEQPPMDQGKELVDQDGLRIVARYVDEDSFWGAGVLLFLENTGDRTVTVSCDDLSVNGFMVTSLFSQTVLPGKMALSEISLLSSDLEENGIEAVEDVELTFRVYDPDSYQTLFNAGPVAFSVGE